MSLVFSCMLACCILTPANAETITLVSEDNWYPYAAFKDGKISGFAVDIVEAAYAKVGIKVQFISAPYSRCLMLARTGQALGCFDSTNDVALAPNYLFHKEPLFKAVIGIYAKSAAQPAPVKVSDLRGHKVGFTHEYTYGDEVETDKKIVREVAPSDLSNLRKLLIGRSDYSLIYTRIFDYLQVTYPAEFNGKIRQVGVVIEDKLFVSFSKIWPDASRYAKLLDQGLIGIRADGTYQKLEKKWAAPEP
ncbi:MAG: transporter substrate-binding domain-containing protein [Undibacterium sp.]|nr:transporter substrate-binding domain-containing protein [Undibacterium sp.]